MRERHNIVGSEVGRPRPPVYLRPASRTRKVRSAPVWSWILMLLPVLAAAFLFIRQAG